MFNEFKKFIARGNVLDLAIAVIIGAAFGTVVKTFTDGIIMPIVGLATGGVDFKQQFWDLSGTVPANATPEQIEAAIKGGKPLLLYGHLISDVLTFLIVAFVMFLLAKYAVTLFKGLEAEAEPTAEEKLLGEIRDILKAK
ncbi:MAG: large conductance mechanosensitive channel protein MscL [Blastocatellia bacterium]|nr:large conductance mechanosensitive channel protein MscL [Blastocatellia bacterium]